MPRPTVPKPLVEKIAAAFAAVGKIPRAGKNKKRRYPYTRATDVFEAVRSHLFKRGVLCCPTEGPAEYVAIGPSNGGEQVTECRIQVTYTFRDALEKLEPMVFNGVGRDVEDKALYKAQTGAQKALLKRFGLLAEVADDPEFDQAETGEILDDVAPMRPRREPKTVTENQIRAFGEACTNTGKSTDEISGYLLTTHKVASIAELGRGRPFTDAIRWASDGKGTLAPKAVAAPAQSNLPLRVAPATIEMRIQNQKVEFQAKDKPFAI